MWKVKLKKNQEQPWMTFPTTEVFLAKQLLIYRKEHRYCQKLLFTEWLSDWLHKIQMKIYTFRFEIIQTDSLLITKALWIRKVTGMKHQNWVTKLLKITNRGMKRIKQRSAEVEWFRIDTSVPEIMELHWNSISPYIKLKNLYPQTMISSSTEQLFS